MKLLVIGCNGQRGKDMMLTAKARGFSTFGLDFSSIDITDLHSVRDAMLRTAP